MAKPAPEKVEAVMWVMKRLGKATIQDLEKATGFSESTCYHAVKTLIHRQKAEVAEYIPVRNSHGGANKIAYRLATGNPGVRIQRDSPASARTIWKPRRARRTGGGKVAGRITIGRGSFWGAGLV